MAKLQYSLDHGTLLIEQWRTFEWTSLCIFLALHIFRILLSCRRDFDDAKILLSETIASIESRVLAEAFLPAVSSGQTSQTKDFLFHQIHSTPSRDREAAFADHSAASMQLHS
jgi:hypothetical protein